MNQKKPLWPALKRLLSYGKAYRRTMVIAITMLWLAAAAEVSGPLLISYFIDNMVAKKTDYHAAYVIYGDRIYCIANYRRTPPLLSKNTV
ncbi:Multidrug resistance-like ATP-binding protein MdlB [Providencia alcalifaciens]|nr:Multidrug resistance-like ATP-binding protein MdlB [Providencia alcalifaciens]